MWDVMHIRAFALGVHSHALIGACAGLSPARYIIEVVHQGHGLKPLSHRPSSPGLVTPHHMGLVCGSLHLHGSLVRLCMRQGAPCMLVGAWAHTGDVYASRVVAQSCQQLRQLFSTCRGGYVCGCTLVICMCILVCTLLISSSPPLHGFCGPAVQQSLSVWGCRKDV